MMRLIQVPMPSLELSVEQRRELWGQRYIDCERSGLSEMMVTRTSRLERLEDPENHRDFLEANEKFRQSVLREIDPYLGRIGTAVELFVGPGIFYRYLVTKIPELYAIDFMPEVLEYLKFKLSQEGQVAQRLYCLPAHEIVRDLSKSPDQGFLPASLDAVFAFRGFHHQPDDEWAKTLWCVRTILKPGGFLVVGEMFRKDKSPSRKTNPSTKYRTVESYSKKLGPKFTCIHTSECFDNDGDPSRVVIWQKQGGEP